MYLPLQHLICLISLLIKDIIVTKHQLNQSVLGFHCFSVFELCDFFNGVHLKQ